jgi:hypothetical protein
MPTLTTNFSFNKPLVNDPVDEDLWGGQLNDNWDSIDGILPVPAASKFGAVVVQSTDDASFEIISAQGTSGTDALVSNGADALPSFQSIIDIVYPVGSLYMNKTVATNPGTLLGVGTWTQITDRFIVARGSTYTGTGGSATVTLTEANLPSSVTIDQSSVGDVNNSVTGNQKIAASASGGRSMSYTVSLGSGTSFSNDPLYQAVYIWERTA